MAPHLLGSTPRNQLAPAGLWWMLTLSCPPNLPSELGSPFEGPQEKGRGAERGLSYGGMLRSTQGERSGAVGSGRKTWPNREAAQVKVKALASMQPPWVECWHHPRVSPEHRAGNQPWLTNFTTWNRGSSG